MLCCGLRICSVEYFYIHAPATFAPRLALFVSSLLLEENKIMTKKKTKVYFDSQGESGNIYHILGQVGNALRKEQRIIEFNEIRDKVFASKSYKEALENIREHVDLIDKSGRE